MKQFDFTSEAVSEGHPDKICDQISDGILDLYLSEDPNARVAIEALVTRDQVILAGEVNSSAHISDKLIDAFIRNLIAQIGYHKGLFSPETVKITSFIHQQSPDISQGVDKKLPSDMGAGDQGLMFGYACNETPAFIPAPLYYAQKILKILARKRKDGTYPFLGPDAKSQITLAYEEEGKPTQLKTLILSTQHDETISQEKIETIIKEEAKALFPAHWLTPHTKIMVNPTGRFVIGGPESDTGLTGRKIIVDTYGGAAPHGGGAFSGKDPSKVDRSAAYMARYIAKNIVASGAASRCLVQLSYAIGVKEPVSFYLNCFGTEKIDLITLQDHLLNQFDLTPYGILKFLDLKRPIYQKTASYGHFGRDDYQQTFSWEKLDHADSFKKLIQQIA